MGKRQKRKERKKRNERKKKEEKEVPLQWRIEKTGRHDLHQAITDKKKRHHVLSNVKF